MLHAVCSTFHTYMNHGHGHVITVALSGAMSHIAGCMGSKVIVAINKDKEANIFDVAHFGIVADYKEVLPALTAKLKELKSK